MNDLKHYETLYLGTPSPPKSIEHAPVAQLDRASDYGSEGLGFESSRARQEIPLQRGIFLVSNQPECVRPHQVLCQTPKGSSIVRSEASTIS